MSQTDKTLEMQMLVDNQSGVLGRITALFDRQGYPICSLSFRQTTDPTLSSVSIITEGDVKTVEHMARQAGRICSVNWVDTRVLPEQPDSRYAPDTISFQKYARINGGE